MYKNLKKITNISSQPIVITATVDGEKSLFEIDAGATEAFYEEVANKFLELRPEFIRDSSLHEMTLTEAAFATQQVQNEVIWVANMTGNPNEDDCPARILIREFSKADRVHKSHEIENPLKKARVWKGHMKGSQEEYTGKGGGVLAQQTPGWSIAIRPFERQPFPKHVGEWILRRSWNAEEAFRGAVQKSRPPQLFEPSMDWELNKLRYYMMFIDPHAKVDCASEEVTRDMLAKSKKRTQLEIDREVLRIKEDLFKRLWLRVVKPNLNLPTSEEFEDFLEVRKAQEERQAEGSAKHREEKKVAKGVLAATKNSVAQASAPA